MAKRLATYSHTTKQYIQCNLIKKKSFQNMANVTKLHPRGIAKPRQCLQGHACPCQKKNPTEQPAYRSWKCLQFREVCEDGISQADECNCNNSKLHQNAGMTAPAFLRLPPICMQSRQGSNAA